MYRGIKKFGLWSLCWLISATTLAISAQTGDVIQPFVLAQDSISTVTNTPVSIVFGADIAVDEVPVTIPKEATFLMKSLQEGIVAIESEEENTWLLQSETPRYTFEFLLSFGEPGKYTVEIGDSTSLDISVEKNLAITPQVLADSPTELDRDTNERNPNLETESNKENPDLETDTKEEDSDLETDTKEEDSDLETGTNEENLDLETGINEEDPELETDSNEENPELETDSIEENPELEADSIEKDSEIKSNEVNLTNVLVGDHFTAHGSTRLFYGNRAVLTNPVRNQAGSITLNNKIDFTQPFDIRGTVRMGNQRHRDMADGMAFGFHSSSHASVGLPGSGMGMAGLNNAFGFKIDTHHNSTASNGAERDPSEYSGGLFGSHDQFGSFMYTDSNTGLLRHAFGHRALNTKFGNQNSITTEPTWRNFVLSYNPLSYTLQFNLDGQIWLQNIRAYLPAYLEGGMSFIISGSTGTSYDLHEIQLTHLIYNAIPAEQVEAQYKDIDTGENILNPVVHKGNVGSRVTLNPQNGTTHIPYQNGYDYVRAESSLPANFNGSNNTFLITERAQTVTYYFKRAQGQVNVHYLDEDQKQLLDTQIENGFVRSEYQITPQEIASYSFVGLGTNSAPLEGKFTRDSQDIYLIYSQDNVSPVDPLEPDVDVNLENPPQLPENQGLVSIDFVSQLDFDVREISTQHKEYFAKPQRLLDEDDKLIEGEYRPNYIQVSDRRTPADQGGWQLSVTQKAPFENDGKELKGAQLEFKNAELVTAQGGNRPGDMKKEFRLLAPGFGLPLITANQSEGQGTWVYRFGNGETFNESVILNVPPSATPSQGTYSTTLEWSLEAVPGTN